MAFKNQLATHQLGMLDPDGGILDRIDSYLFTPAVVFYAIALCQPLLAP